MPKLTAEFHDNEWFVHASDSNGWFASARGATLLDALIEIEQARIETFDSDFPPV
jgi:hypothetical protein